MQNRRSWWNISGEHDTHFPPHPKLFNLWDFLWPGSTDGPSICPQASAPLQALTAQLEGEFHLLNQPEQFLQQFHFHLAASRLHPELALLSRSGGATAHDILGELFLLFHAKLCDRFQILDHGFFCHKSGLNFLFFSYVFFLPAAGKSKVSFKVKAGQWISFSYHSLPTVKDRKPTYKFGSDLLSLLRSRWKILGSLIYSAPKWEIIHATAIFLADLWNVRCSTGQQFALTASRVTRMIFWEDWQTIYRIMDAAFGVFSCSQCVMTMKDILAIKYILPHTSSRSPSALCQAMQFVQS